jgi:hypothetical protein
MALLAQRMDGIDPGLRPDWGAPALPSAPPYAPQPAALAPRPQPPSADTPPPAFVRPRPPTPRRRAFAPDFATRHPGVSP